MPTSTTAEMPTQDDCDIVKDCELALLRGAVRGDRTSATLLLHRDFHEFGASGVVWDRESVLDMMEAEAAEGPVDIKAVDLVTTGLGPGVVLVTYDSVTPTRRAHRSSVWLREAGRWQVRHHQGTVVAD
ncbi:hypothetical protein ASD62_08885 [Phycicoccus sp. Root563]|uniref:nuclear transport factor 2 family protein n=1 Tax=Phycicoccus sp. Root563 TaxID=1736562 RepID=UPI000702F97E|nr:DUF4440 domain-containing protein [Phycicoccus sp. Root563]KQZ89402.1 hypothetical protein ASD62_08885 [Phycicoccus sp. Root563]